MVQSQHHITESKDKIPRGQKVAYGLGAMSTNVAVNSFSNLTLLIYNSGLGLNPVLLGIAQSVPRLWDAITDPMIGNLSDNTRSRFGRRIPYIFVGAFLLGLAFALLWMAPKGWNQYITFGYVLVVCLFFFTAATIYDVPRGALGFEMTDDYHERTRLFAYCSFFINVGALTTPWLYFIATRKIFKNEIEGMRYVGYFMGALMLFGGLVCSLFCKERKTQQIKLQPRVKFWDSIKMTSQNKTFIWLLAVMLPVTIGFYFVNGFSQYIMLYYVYGGDKPASSVLMGVAGTLWAALSLPGVFVMTFIATRIGKAKTMMLFLILMALGNSLKMFCYSKTYPWLVLIPTASLSLGMLVLFSLVYAMLADICDEDELNTGKRREGSYQAVYGWWWKIGIAGALLVSGILLKATGFNEKIAVQSESTLFWLRFWEIGLPSVMCLVSVLLLTKYPLT
ncbi:MAG: Melibiose carrier protein [Planctomycetes bacterium ADurb.Bin401]|nr:MAG: Melibiose carrier protein [Planctomycetes bacterium ADurb.Bin401]